MFRPAFLSASCLAIVLLGSLSFSASPRAAAPAKEVVWASAYDEATQEAAASGKVIFVAVNMDGERANDRMVKNVYKDKKIVSLSENTVNLVASAAEHKKSGECSRFGGVECEQHRFVDIDVRRNILKADATGAVVSPQHVFLTPKGEVLLSVPYEVSPGELEWCFLEALSTVNREFSPKASRTARKPRRLIVGDVIAQGDGVASAITREEALNLVAELKKGKARATRDRMLYRLVTADEPEARDYVLSVLRAGAGDGSARGGRGGNSDPAKVRGELIRWIGTASPPTYWELCAEFANSGTPSVKREAVVALEQLSASGSLPTLMKAYKRASESVDRKNLLRAIGASARGDKKARKEVLKASIDKRDTVVRANALLALGWLDADDDVDSRLGEAALPATLGTDAKIKPDKVTSNERLAAVVAMGLSRRADWKELLTGIDGDESEDEALREAARQAILVIDGEPYGALRSALRMAGGDEIPRDRLFPEVIVRPRK